MKKTERFILLLLSILLVVFVYLFMIKKINISNPIQLAIITLMVLIAFGVFIFETYFTKPNDIIANSISLIILILPLHNNFASALYVFWVLLSWYSVSLIISIVSLLLFNSTEDPLSKKNRTAFIFRRLSSFMGSSRTIYSMTIFAFTFVYLQENTLTSLVVLFYTLVIILINTRKSVFRKIIKEKKYGIGYLNQVNGSKSFEFALYNGLSIDSKTLVAFNLKEEKNITNIGVIMNKTVTKENTFYEFAVLSQISKVSGYISNILYKYDGIIKDFDFDNFVGLTTTNSKIDKIRFRCNLDLSVNLEKGNVVSCIVNSKEVLYQIIEATLKREEVEEKDLQDYIEVEAFQLGTWDNVNFKFEKFNWIPNQYTPVMLYDSKKQNTSLKANEKVLGYLVGTNIPVVNDLELGVTHHTAILGITGTGKSVFARDYIRALINSDTKVICIDFTNEYKGKFGDLTVHDLIDNTSSASIFTAIDSLGWELAKFKNQQNKYNIQKLQQQIKSTFDQKVADFIADSNTDIAILSLPDVSNSEGVLEYTKYFMKSVLDYSKTTKGTSRICVVIEEAHTVIPEWNFAGIDDKISKPLVNTMSQIALQGRKYNLGFIVIAQRTANVSKTILTQCNSLIMFNQFDNTSKDFLSNYIGRDYASLLSTLKSREAISIGISMKSNTPMIFRVPDIIEPNVEMRKDDEQ